MNIGNVWGDPELFTPKRLDLDIRGRRARVFVGDNWIEVGKISVTCNGTYVEIKAPDIEAFIAQRHTCDDGTVAWCLWGPLVN